MTETGRTLSASAGAARRFRYKQLLFINDYPPCNVAGAPIIVHKLLRSYDPERLDVLYCGSWEKAASGSLLPCRHTAVRAFTTNLRPRRLFGPLEATLNCARLDGILRRARRIARERRVEAIFSTSYGAEMPHAAYFLSRELGLPFYYFEMDRLDAFFLCRKAEKLITENRGSFLRSAAKLWLISPAMVSEYRELYGVEGEVLHHFLDVEESLRSVREAPGPPNDRLRIVYTGTINLMLEGTMRWLCERLNRGISVAGRPVELFIYSSHCPRGLVGPHVTYQGFVPPERIPAALASGHALLSISAFDAPEGYRRQVRTSVATKTGDYLAAGKPMLLIAPPESALYQYCRDVSAVVDRLEHEPLIEVLTRLATDVAYVAELTAKGLELARRSHSLGALERSFLANFRRPL